MAAKYDNLRLLEEDSASMLCTARDKKRGTDCCLRRFKTRKPEEIDGLKELFGQLDGIDSPHVEKLMDFGTDKEGFFVVTDLQQGETLEEALQRGPLTAEEFEVVALQLLDILDVLHEQAIVHGAIRPDYVRIIGKSRKDWRIILGGFGQGFAVKDETKEAQIRAYRCTAPEQWQDGTTRRRTDVYALGCVLYESLAARPPFDGRALKELRMKHLGHDLAPLQKLTSHVPAWMSAWVMHLMAADPEQRPRKAAAARELFLSREAPPVSTPPPQAAPPPAAAAPSSTTPPVSLAQAVSAPVMLPAAQTMVRNVTSSTIPISTGPRIAKPGVPTPQRRPSTAILKAPSRPSPAPKIPVGPFKWNLKPTIITAAAVVAILSIFGISRCGKKPPAPNKPAAAKKK